MLAPAVNNFSWTAGKQPVKFGYEFRRTSITQFLGTNFRGRLVFDTLADFLAGNVTEGTQSLGYSQRHSYQNNHSLYFQDSYRVMPNLTLNYGMRWDYFGVFHEKNNLLSNIASFDPTGGTVALTLVGQPGLGASTSPTI